MTITLEEFQAERALSKAEALQGWSIFSQLNMTAEQFAKTGLSAIGAGMLGRLHEEVVAAGVDPEASDEETSVPLYDSAAVIVARLAGLFDGLNKILDDAKGVDTV